MAKTTKRNADIAYFVSMWRQARIVLDLLVNIWDDEDGTDARERRIWDALCEMDEVVGDLRMWLEDEGVTFAEPNEVA